MDSVLSFEVVIYYRDIFEVIILKIIQLVIS